MTESMVNYFIERIFKKEEILYKLDSLKENSKNAQKIVDFYHNFIKIKNINYFSLFPHGLWNDDKNNLRNWNKNNNWFKEWARAKCTYFPAVIIRNDCNNSEITKLEQKNANEAQIDQWNNFFNIFIKFIDIERNQGNTWLKWKSNIPNRFIKLRYIGNENEEKIEHFLKNTGMLWINQLTILCLRVIENKSKNINKVFKFIKQIVAQKKKNTHDLIFNRNQNKSTKQKKIEFYSQNLNLITYHYSDIICLKNEIEEFNACINSFFEKFNQNIYYFCKGNEFYSEYLNVIRHEKMMAPWLFK